MTQANTPQDPLDRLAMIVERFINASSDRQDQMEAAQIHFQERQGQLERAQIRFQEQLGELASYVRQVVERQDRHDRELEEIRQRQVESDLRFDVLLQEIRYLIRRREDRDD